MGDNPHRIDWQAAAEMRIEPMTAGAPTRYVYLVMERIEYEGDSILACYSTLKLAQAHIDAINYTRSKHNITRPKGIAFVTQAVAVIDEKPVATTQ